MALGCQSNKFSWLFGCGILSDPHKVISQSGYVFMYGGTAISWRSTKQTLVATSSNHAKLIALLEVGRDYQGAQWIGPTQDRHKPARKSPAQDKATTFHDRSWGGPGPLNGLQLGPYINSGPPKTSSIEARTRTRPGPD
ncbi:UNVERIFIED_CONTAM: hypothetical protein Scaly_2573200 [Sesamum calycinum]|uniref:Uncharacterized protein n=1 Tax=Sesamum calycinum TaxID=2727403 RepID=A0AAW2JI93_9LAMI